MIAILFLYGVFGVLALASTYALYRLAKMD